MFKRRGRNAGSAVVKLTLSSIARSAQMYSLFGKCKSHYMLEATKMFIPLLSLF